MTDTNSAARFGTYWLTRFVLLRLLGCVYAVAFFAAARQILPLIGAHGLTPLDAYLVDVRTALGSSSVGFFRLPSLFWLAHSDTMLVVCAWLGVALSLVVVAGYANSILMAVLWLL
ncbi:MAG TPA: lipase maturation factor family protein, partial [Polyangia bacterium]|nr:lipase maturation factor family protein [Polyangia bacterium]